MSSEHTERDRSSLPGSEGATGSPVAELLLVAAPAVVTMTSYTLMQFVDKWILSNLGADEVAGAGNGGIIAFVPGALIMGLVTVVNTYVSQNLGAGRAERGAAYAWNGLWMVLALWAALLLPLAAFLPEVFSAMRSLMGVSEPPARLLELETTYGRIMTAGLITMLLARALHHYFYGVHRAWVVMVSALTANVCNVGLTWVLALGYEPLGIPSLGVAGAAWGTVIGGAIEFIIPMAIFLSPKYARELHTRVAWRPSLEHVKDILRIGWPAGAMFGNEIVCWWVMSTGLVGHFDPPNGVATATAAGWITLQYMHLSFMPAVGLSIAVTAVVGKYIGAGRPDIAARRTWLGLSIATVYMGFAAMAFLLFRVPMMKLFTGGYDPAVAEEVVRIGASILIVAAAFQLFDAVAITLSGALRGAGDTIWPGIVTVILSWTFIVGGGRLLIEVAPELGPSGPWIGAATFITLLALAMLARFVGGKWRSMSVVKDGPEVAATAPDTAQGVIPELPGTDVPDLDPDGGSPTQGSPSA
ncbi:MAG: MATE family efflux transporter [Planctomycetota bacterium]